MSSFAPQVAAPTISRPDQTKHVNYTLGMVLGVDDFTQEFAYLSGRDQWLARDLLGYGTICGLQITAETDARGPRIVVTSGVAVSQSGQMIRVPLAQCAYLNDWLVANNDQIDLRLGAMAGGDVRLYIVLCYRECPTDQVPIPGEPCRSEDEIMAASRLKDDYVLELRFAAPDQQEEDALRDFVAWLSQIEIVAAGSPPAGGTLQDFIAAIRSAAPIITSPPSSPLSPPASSADFLLGSPPAGLQIPADQACDYLRAAFRVWTTELRPRWRPTFSGEGGGCGAGPLADPADEDCVMLAELTLPVTRTLEGVPQVASTTTVEVNEERRPYLLHLRLLQEWLLCGRSLGAGGITGTGDRGPAGDQGPTGDKGPAGDKGPIGDKGPTGDKGPPGDPSGAGETVGSQGPPGDKGPAGDTGPAGDQGPVGDRGSAGDKGAAGDQGPAGDRGPIGDKGPIGDQGPVGDKGPVGDQGPRGEPGSPGDGAFVARPAAERPFEIVAAGLVTLKGPNRDSYNGLRIVDVRPDPNSQHLLVSVTFDGYRAAPPEFPLRYIVKVLPVFVAEVRTGMVVNFDHFEAEFFVLRVLPLGTKITDNEFGVLEFMIEVSQYPSG